MPKLPAIKPKDLINILEKAGFFIDHQTGSHVTLIKPKTNKRTVVSRHNKDLKKGTLKAILKQSGLSIEDIN